MNSVIFPNNSLLTLTCLPVCSLAAPYFTQGAQRIGGRYIKARYVEYTDSTFKVLKSRDDSTEHLGMLGPVIMAEAGETVEIRLKNMADRPYSFFPHGVLFSKENEGFLYKNPNSEFKLRYCLSLLSLQTYDWASSDKLPVHRHKLSIYSYKNIVDCYWSILNILRNFLHCSNYSFRCIQDRKKLRLNYSSNIFSANETEGQLVLPGEVGVYRFRVPLLAPDDLPCVTHTYHSAVDPVRDINTGLVGPLVVCARGQLSRHVTMVRPSQLNTYMHPWVVHTHMTLYFVHFVH